jgi:type IV secretory pathway TrbD component
MEHWGHKARDSGDEFMTGRLIGTMPQMAQPKAVDDPRLWATAYVEFFVRGADPDSRKSRLLLEQDPWYMSKAVGNLAMYLMDAVWLPVNFGVDWTTSWVEVDYARRSDPDLRKALARRNRYQRLGTGYTLRPKYRLRKTAADVVGMLWLAYQAEHHAGEPMLYGSEPVVVMLHKYRARFGHTSGTCGNA